MGIGEDSGKKERIREFLERVGNGLGYVEDIWIDRKLKPLDSSESYSSGRSLSGKPVQTLSELLKDDIDHTFDKGLFTFRFIAASPGSGKTTTLNYLKELIDVEASYKKSSIVVSFAFNELLSESIADSFGVKFYSFIFSQTLWNIFREDNHELSDSIKSSAREFLTRLASKEKVAQIESNSDEEIMFTHELNNFLLGVRTNFKKLFFSLVRFVAKKNPESSFVYLIDELDALHSHSDYLNDARSVIRDLINEAVGVQRIRLMVYIVGVQDDVQTFIMADEALHSRVSNSVINLIRSRMEECNQIREKIESRIRDAYSGCQGFNAAWSEIQNIQLESPHDFKTLRDFCKKYAHLVIEIHEKYFKFFDKSFNKYESKAREMFESKARDCWRNQLGYQPTEDNTLSPSNFWYLGHNQWKSYKGKSGYSILVAQTTTNYEGHNLDCYAELRHNNSTVAQAYGEAKNYNLIEEHLITFFEWLDDFGYRVASPEDLAFMIAPSCSDLKLRKLHKRGVEFIEIEKSHDLKVVGTSPTNQKKSKDTKSSFNINSVSRSELYSKFKGTRINRKTLDKIFDNRTYKDQDELFEKVQLTPSTQKKIADKCNKGEMIFS